jgi:hypothetical protein
MSEIFKATGSVADRNKQPWGKVTSLRQYGQILFSLQRDRELNARVTSRGTVYIRANGGYT